MGSAMTELGTGRWSKEYAVAVAAVREAAEAIRGYYDAASAAVYTKADASPVTDADLASDRILRAHLTTAFPDDAILSEEVEDDRARLSNDRVWLADPLDGTQQFIDRTGAFDVFLALVVGGRPVVAATAHPPSGTVLSAIEGRGAWFDTGAGPKPLRVPALDPAIRPRLSTNRYHTLPEDWPLLVAVAEEAGFTPPPGPHPAHPRAYFVETGGPDYEAFMGIGRGPNGATVGGEWDLAAPDLILHEAGGRFTDELGRTITYNRDHAAISHGIIAAIDPAYNDLLASTLATLRGAGSSR
jgi:3'-phosphoadenosine 5'-phosphosulfate (PAPS) 3'-phosphatase